MLYSYQNASEVDLPERCERFVSAQLSLKGPEGMILSHEALSAFLSHTGVGREVAKLIHAVTDDESQKRVDNEVWRRIVTARIPDEVAAALTEAVEVLGLHRQEVEVYEVPLVAVLYTDGELRKQAAVVNISGTKGLADAVRQLWAELFVSPYPEVVPMSAICLFRMPPAEKTCEVRVGERFHVSGGEGWGWLVGSENVGDEYMVDLDSLAIVESHINRQPKMFARNPRSGEMARSVPPDAASQKLTEEQLRLVSRDTRRTGEDSAVFGMHAGKHWLLAFPHDSAPIGATTVPRKEPEEYPELPVAEQADEPAPPEPAEDPEIEIVELSEEERAERSEPHDEQPEFEEPEPEEEPETEEPRSSFDGSYSTSEVVDASHDRYGEVSHDDVESEVEEAFEDLHEDEDDDDRPVSAAAQVQVVAQLSARLVEEALAAIEATLREWLYGDQPQALSELVNRVSAKRPLPYKQRVLALAEQLEAGELKDPDADQVQYVLDTMERFLKEF